MVVVIRNHKDSNIITDSSHINSKLGRKKKMEMTYTTRHLNSVFLYQRFDILHSVVLSLLCQLLLVI